MRTALLDIDGTLVEDGLWSLLIRQLLTDGVGEEKPLRSCLEDLQTPGRSGMAAVRRDIPGAFTGIDSDALTGAARRAWRHVRLMPFTLDLARLLHRHGVRVVLISGAPQILAERVGDLFSASEVVACEIDPGMPDFARFIDSPQVKTEMVRQSFFRHGEDPSRTMAIGNGFNDAGLFSMSAFPIAFEPTRRLREKATEEGWEITDRHGLMQCVETALELR